MHKATQKSPSGGQTGAEQERQWHQAMQAWQSRYEVDKSVTPHEETALTGHTKRVTTLTVLLDGRLASGSLDNDIRLWDLKRGTCEATLRGHTNGVLTLTVLPDGRLASGSLDDDIRLWDLKRGTCETTLRGHTKGVLTLTVLPDGRLASGSLDDDIRLWDLKRGTCEATLRGHMYSVLTLTVLPDGRLASGSNDNDIRLWDLKRGTCEATLAGHTNALTTLTVLPDGRLASGSNDNAIRLWDLKRGTCEATLAGHTYSILTLTVLPDGRLASGSLDYDIRLWDLKRGTCEATLAGHTKGVTTLTVLPDGRLASGSSDYDIRLWDLKRGTCEATLAGRTSYVSTLMALPDGRLASGGGNLYGSNEDKSIRVWDVGVKLRQTLDPAAKVSLDIQGSEAAQASHLMKAAKPPVAKASQVQGSEKAAQGEKTLREAQLQQEVTKLAQDKETLKAQQEKHAQEMAQLKEKLAVEEQRASEAEKQAREAERQVQAAMPPTPPKTSATTPDVSCECRDRCNMTALGVALPVRLIPAEEVTLGHELGRGGFGVVYEGHYDFRKVAVKCYEGGRLPERAAQEVRHEVGIMLQLDHECLVRFFGLVQQQGSPAMLVMEHGANGSLYNYLHNKQDFPWGLRVRLAEELARGLAYLHKKKVVHRDIKSLNVVLDKDFHAKWCDFGLAALKLHTKTTNNSESQSPVGTIHWMAPELFSRKTSSPSTASDIWALGMVYFELASRAIPYATAMDRDQIREWIKEGDGEDIPEECKKESPLLANLMERCWKDRTLRPTAVEIVRELGGSAGSGSDTRDLLAGKAAADSGFIPFSNA